MVFSAKNRFWRRHLDKISIALTTVASFCVLEIPALASPVFPTNSAVLVLLWVSLVASLWGLYRDIRRHQNWTPYAIGLAGAILTFTGNVVASSILVAIGIALLVTASILNVVYRKKGAERV